MGQIVFPDVMTRVLRLIGQDRFGLVEEAVGILERQPERCGGLQPFGQQLVQRL